MNQLLFDAHDYPAAERLARWCAGITDFAVEMVDPDEPFDGRSTVTGLGPLPISESRLPALRFRRTPALIRAERRDHVSLSLVVAGTLSGHADGMAFHLGPGGVLLLDLARPAEVVSTRGGSMVVLLPRNLLGLARPGQMHGPLQDSAETRLLVAYLHGLSAAMPAMDPASARGAARALCELVAACLPPAVRAGGSRRADNVRERLVAYVEAHLDRALTVEGLCAALAVSRSALYRAATKEGGVRGLIRTVRLEAAHRLLAERTERRGIQEIARSIGFADPAQFSRHFHTAFGYTAAQLRREAAARSALPAQAEDPAVAFRQAVDRLATGPNAG